MTPPLPHASLGANASFTTGGDQSQQGFALSNGRLLRQELIVGCRSAPDSAWSLLPFFSPEPSGLQPLSKGRYGRFLAAAGDKWMIGPLVFKLCTPFPLSVADEDEAFWYAPAISGYLEYDNSHNGEPAEMVFGISGHAEVLDAETGFAFGEACGFTTSPSAEVRLLSRDNCPELSPTLANGIRFFVPAHAKRIFPLVIGFHDPALFYAATFPDLRAVLKYGLTSHDRRVATSDALDAKFMRSSLSPAEKSAFAYSVRELLAGSRRMRNGDPVDLNPIRELWTKVAPHSE